ncbi:hypothetical protein H4R34_002301 [Dimargaris verticillata]|uniref:Zinc/iron permease n=1 Tax=Dimargaris verticillata TaxID=2761393 RepID=A0A9W8B432_9FUNG|nr:hypothetical protein H4R34_002301 [Dimargaris verticillata]
MFVGSLLFGALPLAVPLSPKRLQALTVFGAGLLLGTALLVILPEGVEALYSAYNVQAEAAASSLQPHQWLGVATAMGFAWMFIIDTALAFFQGHSQHHHHHHHSTAPSAAEQHLLESGLSDSASPTSTAQTSPTHKSHRIDCIPLSDLAASESPRTTLVRDSRLRDPSHSNSDGSDYRRRTSGLESDDAAEWHAPDSNGNGNQHRQRSTSTLLSAATIGMLVHAAADGMALGAATATAVAEASHNHDHGDESNRMSTIIFLAILLHKAPEAFGLCMRLLQERHSKRAIAQTLCLFSAAAPLLALVTYGTASLVQLARTKGDRLLQYTAILLLFSAGTFLYVATIHSLPEALADNDHLPQQTTATSVRRFRKQRLQKLAILLVGTFLPALITFGHHHH